MRKRSSEEQVIGFLKEGDPGVPVQELCRRHGSSEASYYLWRSKFGGMDVSDAKRLKQLDARPGPVHIAGQHLPFPVARDWRQLRDVPTAMSEARQALLAQMVAAQILDAAGAHRPVVHRLHGFASTQEDSPIICARLLLRDCPCINSCRVEQRDCLVIPDLRIRVLSIANDYRAIDLAEVAPFDPGDLSKPHRGGDRAPCCASTALAAAWRGDRPPGLPPTRPAARLRGTA